MAPTNLEVRLKCAKYMVVCVTVFFWLTYAIVISLGRAINAVYHKVWVFLEDDFLLSSIFVIVIGIAMLGVTIFGCVGTFSESRCLVNIFAVILSIVLVLEIATVAITYSLRAQVSCVVSYRMRSKLRLYDKDSDIKEAFDFIQNRLDCCGVDSYKDWAESPLSSGITIANVTVPNTCCAESNVNVVGNMEIYECIKLYTNGCLPRLSALVYDGAALLSAGALTICVMQIIGVVYAFSLASRIPTPSVMF